MSYIDSCFLCVLIFSLTPQKFWHSVNTLYV